MQVGLLSSFAGQLGYSGNGFTFFFGVLYLLQHNFGYQRVFVKEIVHFRFYEIAHIFVYGRTVGPHIVGAEFCFGLAFEHGLFHINGNGGHQSVADVGIILVLVIELLDGAGYMFL